VRTFAVVNQKGGCGKTTTAINLAGVFAARGYKTLLVDMDPQGHCAAGLAIPEQRIDLHIGDAMLAGDEPVDMQRLLWRVSRNLDLAPSTVRLAALEAPRGELASHADAHERLKKVLARLDGQYDVCLIDCSPAIGLLAFNALVAADEVLIPVETGFFSLQGANKQVNAVKSIGKRLGVQPVHRLLATMHDPGSVLSQDLLDELRRRFGSRVLPVVVRLDQSLKEAASLGQPVIEYAPESSGASDYVALAEYLVKHALSGEAQTDSTDDGQAPSPAGSLDPARSSLTSARLPASPVSAASALVPESATARAALASGPQRTVVIEADPIRTPHSEPLSRSADIASRARKLQTAAAIAAGVPNVPIASQIESLPLPRVAPAAQAASSPMVLPAAAAPAFGVHVLGRTLVFRQPLTLGQHVAIAGDFNHWSPERTTLRLDLRAGVLEAIADLPPGASSAQYRLVVDGRWMPDPFNPSTCPNPFGGFNSFVHVHPASAA